jgi:hypothetical protein
MTVHMTKHNGEQYLDEIEAELIAPTYSEMGFIDSMDQLERIAS